MAAPLDVCFFWAMVIYHENWSFLARAQPGTMDETPGIGPA
jgi:hypothetical protein